MKTTNATVDIHTHILPCMDDGSASVEESLQLIAELSRQGVHTIAATPHFYADREDPDAFLERRTRAFELICGKYDPRMTVLTGAEVYYYPGISRSEHLPKLTIGSTKLLLVEMPFCDWTASMAQELLTIQRTRGLDVVIAHIDRYFGIHNTRYRDEMLQNGILFQVNASALLDKKRRTAVFHLLKQDAVQFVASDCHNMKTRPPKLEEAYAVIGKKFGAGYAEWLREVPQTVLESGDSR